MKPLWKEAGLTQKEYDLLLQHLGREPNPTETALYGVMWSEHCGYKNTRPLFKNFPTTGPRILQGPGENAGIVDIDDDQVITFKVESHNHPSAIAPFQGAATGVGGIIRDILAMGAKPIGVLNSLHFATPKGKGHTKWLISEVIRGIGDYGNCIGIPTIGGEVRFAETYRGNPLVNAMCVGLMNKSEIQTASAEGPGNSLMIVGNLTGRDGIGGASFASKELDETNQEDRGAVQVGDPFMEKLLIDACLEVFAKDFVVGVQDMGAAGIISSTSETASKAGNGVEIDVSLVPTREAGMSPAEIMISESQERMLLIVKQGREDEVNAIFHKWDLHAVVIGNVTNDGFLRVKEGDVTVAEIPAASLTDAPIICRVGKVPDYLSKTQSFDESSVSLPDDMNATLQKLVSSPNIASRRWVYRQYDHMVQTNTVVRPGGNTGVLRIKGTQKAVTFSTDANGRYCYLNPKEGSKIVIAEAARNHIASGALPIAVTDGLNFGNPEKPEIFYQLEQSILGISEACRVLDTPIISGNASLYNETPDQGAIYPTPVIGMAGLIKNVEHITTKPFKRAGDVVFQVGDFSNEIGASEYLEVIHGKISGDVPKIELALEKRTQDFVLNAIQKSIINSATDIGDGGLAIALTECLYETKFGASIEIPESSYRLDALLFGEAQSRFLLSVAPDNMKTFQSYAEQSNIPISKLGIVNSSGNLRVRYQGESVIEQDVTTLESMNEATFPEMMR
jgi:phosphoribosylformylglycinamidine synthase subunit PurL